MLSYFLHGFCLLKTDKWMKDSHPLIATPLLWHCDVMQTPIVTSFWLIVMKTFPSGSCASSHRHQVDYHSLIIYGVGGAVRFLVVGTIGQRERPPRGQLWMEQCLTLLKYWPIKFTIGADLNYTWGLAILSDSLLFSVNNILVGLWLNYISSVEITFFLLADILLQHRALFQC